MTSFWPFKNQLVTKASLPLWSKRQCYWLRGSEPLTLRHTLKLFFSTFFSFLLLLFLILSDSSFLLVCFYLGSIVLVCAHWLLCVCVSSIGLLVFNSFQCMFHHVCIVNKNVFWQTFSLAMNTSDKFLLFPAYIWIDSNISLKKKKVFWNVLLTSTCSYPRDRLHVQLQNGALTTTNGWQMQAERCTRQQRFMLEKKTCTRRKEYNARTSEWGKKSKRKEKVERPSWK